MQIETAIFLGGGASKAEGAPLQNELFRRYFSSDTFKNSHDEMDKELTTFFSKMFNIDVNDGPFRNNSFPTFEEALALTDLAILRKESFKDFDIENRASNSGRLRFISQYLVFLLAKVLDTESMSSEKHHRKLVNKLLENDVLQNCFFVSTNYDILIDNALTELYSKDIDLDYGIDFRNFERKNDWERPRRDKSVHLFKPHGSLNWLYCPTCNTLEITPKEKGVVTRLISDFRKAACQECESVFMPLIVPPTYYKDLTNIFLASIWNKAENMLRKARHVIFCGYSFPDSDIHLKYLLKRSQVNKKGHCMKFTVINHFNNKNPILVKEEEDRYKRFLGQNVHFTEKSFEEFAENPLPVINY